MQIINTADPTYKPKIVMLVYGEGGVGKTTFASTAPKPLLIDCENGAKYLGLRGIKIDVAGVNSYTEFGEAVELAKKNGYETIVIDPVGELMGKLKQYMLTKDDTKLVQKDGNPTMAGWGWMKTTLRNKLKYIRDTGLHVLIVAHVETSKDEDRQIKQPLIETKLADDLINMVDIVGYMTVQTDPETKETKRVILVDPTSDKFRAKDRTGQLGTIIEPNYTKIVEAIHGTKNYKWAKEQTPADPKEKAKVECACKVVKQLEDEFDGKEVKPEPKAEPKKETNKSKAEEALAKANAKPADNEDFI